MRADASLILSGMPLRAANDKRWSHPADTPGATVLLEGESQLYAHLPWTHGGDVVIAKTRILL